MSADKKGDATLQTLGIAVLALGTLVLVGLVLFSGPSEPSPTTTTGPAAPVAVRPRDLSETERPVFNGTPVQRAPVDKARQGAPLPLVAQLRNNGQLQQQLAQMRVRPVGSEAAQRPPAEADFPSSPTPTGTVDVAELRAAMKGMIPAAKHCYESSLKMKPDSHGVVKIGFTLVAGDGGGAVRDAEIVESDLANPVADACLLDAMTTAKFPAPLGGNGEVKITYPLRLEQDAPQK